MKHRKKHIWASIMILLIVAFDQVTKRLAESALMGGKIVTLLPGAVQLRYARNLIDRVLYGYVIDFIEPTFMQFAVFNIADCAVTCGGISFVLWLAVDLFRSGDGKKGTTHDGK